MAQESNSSTLKVRTRRIAKRLAVESGAMGLYHRVKHREVLTVLMFHRVLPEKRMSAYEPDKEYTVSTALFEDLLQFAAAHYNIVSLDDVLRSRGRIKPLPDRPLLITFDDGWDDNALFAAPILARLHMPWTLFVATDAIGTDVHWWQESLLAAVRSGSTNYEELKSAAINALQGKIPELPDDRGLSILVLFGALPPAERDSLIATYCGDTRDSKRPRDMASWETLKSVHEAGVAIGGHGTSHLPLTLVNSPEREIFESKSALEKSLGKETGITMSFPHGRYSASIVETARGQGMKLLFSSDPILNKCQGGWLESDVIGRISISKADVTDAAGALQLDRLMPWLMLRPLSGT
jgi:peptidoglycan/xylan/chitin deacetylase (PgdA/CDA1 family)